LAQIVSSAPSALHSSLNVSDQVSHPYKTTGKITILYILNFWIASKKRNKYTRWTIGFAIPLSS
jgi:hypothetical protein